MNFTTQKDNKTNLQLNTVDLSVCAFCLGSEDDVEQYGRIFRCKKESLVVHEYCLFFASGLAQNGKDNEGFDGFLFQDIKKELKRASKLRCTFCSAKGAATGCCISKCSSSFHFKCGLKRHALFQFFGTFRSFCRKHRPTQKIQKTDFLEAKQSPTCPICLCDVERSNIFNTLKSPCCKNAWFHRSCIQKQALANGMYFFRCAFCNNLDQFQEEMKIMGIYIPDRDAIWEQGNEYEDLLRQYNQCDAVTCCCPKGRDFTGRHKGQKWKIFRCLACGQSGIHQWCQMPEMSSKQFLCQNCKVCFPSQEPGHGESQSLNDSQSTTDYSCCSEISQEINSASLELNDEEIPLSQLKKYLPAKIEENNKSDVPGMVNHCVISTDKISSHLLHSLDTYEASIPTDSSNYLDAKILRSDSSFHLSDDSIVLLDEYQSDQRDNCIERREGPERSLFQLERTKQTESKQGEVSSLCVASDGALDHNTSESFHLLLSPESDSYDKCLKMQSPNKDKRVPLFDLGKECNDNFHESLNQSLNKLQGIRASEKRYGTADSAINVESLPESEFQMNATSYTADMPSPSKGSDCSAISTSTCRKKLLQTDIRSMLTSQNQNGATNPVISPIKHIENKSCQTTTIIKKHRANKKRKLGSCLSECKSITTFMSINESSPKRKSSIKTSLDFDDRYLINAKVLKQPSSSIMDTRTAAKGMVMQLPDRLSGSLGFNKQNYSIPEKNCNSDFDSTSIDSWKSGLSIVRGNNGKASVIQRESLEDSDSSGSIKVVNIRKGKGRCEGRLSPLYGKRCSAPISSFHQKNCNCCKAQAEKAFSCKPNKVVDPSEYVIVIDSENDDQDSGKGSSRDTSDAGVKSGNGSDVEGNLSVCYSSYDELPLYTYNPIKNDDKEAAVDDINGSESGIRKNYNSLHSVSHFERAPKRGLPPGRKYSKKSKTDGKKKTKCDTNFSKKSGKKNRPSHLLRESLENSYLTNINSFDNEGNDIMLESNICSENNFQESFQKKGKSRTSKKTGAEQHGLSPLTHKSKLNLPSLGSKFCQKESKQFGFKMNMKCSDEEFQGKKKLISKAKKNQNRKLKKRKLHKQDKEL